MLETTQRILKENSHGMLFGLVASLIVFIIRNIIDKEVMFWITIYAVLIGAAITHFLKVPKGFFTEKAVLITVGIISALLFFGAQTGLFSLENLVGGTAKTALTSTVLSGGKWAILGGLGAFLSTFNIFLGIIALIMGILILGIPLHGLIDTIKDNFVLVLIVAGLVLLFALMSKRK